MFGKNNSGSDIIKKRLKECPLFSGLSGGELKSLLAIAHTRDYSENEIIFGEGTIGLCFYLIIKGSVKIITGNESDTVVVKEFSEGGFFSEVHLFSETTHSVSCAASEVSRLLVLAKPDIEELVNSNSRLGNKILLAFLDFFGQRLDELFRENNELKSKLLNEKQIK